MTLVDRARLVSLLAATLLFLQPHAACAQSAEAEVLFRTGRALLKQGKLAEGCDKLEASERLENSVGTLLNLGDCKEKLGQLSSAWAAFRKAEATAKRAGNDEKREAEAGKRAALLEPQLPSLVIRVARPIDGLVVRRGDEIVEAAGWNTEMPVDPGTYPIVAEAPGHLPWRTTVQVTIKSRRQLVVVPALEHVPVAREPEPPALVAPPPAPPPRIVEPTHVMTVRHHRTWSTARTLSAVLGVAGAGALGTGVYFGLQSKDEQDRADQRCPLSLCADPEGLRLNSDARASATRANVLYAAGGAAVVTAVVLWLAGAPGDETIVTPTIGDGHVGVSYARSF